MTERLQAFGFTLDLAPDIGGSVAALSWRGMDILRPASTGAISPLDCSAFPMAPFPGRIAQGRFNYDGQSYSLPPNMPPEPHAIHGMSWQEPWSVDACSDTAITLTHHHNGSVWPWPYIARQVFALSEAGLRLELSVENQGATPMPSGLGWHPYFLADDAEFRADVETIWAGREGDGPIDLTPGNDLRRISRVADLSLDHAFAGETCRALILYKERGLQITLNSDVRHTVVYTPNGKPYFCVEPLTQTPNAINMDLPAEVTGAVSLAPGDLQALRVELSVQSV